MTTPMQTLDTLAVIAPYAFGASGLLRMTNRMRLAGAAVLTAILLVHSAAVIAPLRGAATCTAAIAGTFLVAAVSAQAVTRGLMGMRRFLTAAIAVVVVGGVAVATADAHQVAPDAKAWADLLLVAVLGAVGLAWKGGIRSGDIPRSSLDWK